MELATFFLSLPQPVLRRYIQLHLKETRTAAKPDQEEPAAELAALFADRHWVRARLKELSRSQQLALIALLQCQGVAGGTWLLQELTQSHGMSEDRWAEVLHSLGNQLWVFGNSHQSPPLFYILPAPLAEQLEHQFRKRLDLRALAKKDGIRTGKENRNSSPTNYSLVLLITYLDQHRLRVTQQGELFKKDQQELLEFFASLWAEKSPEKLLSWFLDFIGELGLARQRNGFLEIDTLALEEFLGMKPWQRRDLQLAYFHRKEPLLSWLLELLANIDERDWVDIHGLRTLYRRRYMGDVFRRRYIRKSYYLPPSGFYDPDPPLELLQLAGLIETGLSEKGSYLRLGGLGRIFMEEGDVESLEAQPQSRCIAQPNFKVLAPIGTPLKTLWSLGTICDLEAADRASTFSLTRESVRSALDSGWRSEALVGFLTEVSSVGLPQNVNSTIVDWMGRHGEIELHDCLIITCTRNRSKEVQRILKGLEFRWEKLATTVFAIPRERQQQTLIALKEAGAAPSQGVRRHDLADEPENRRGPLHAALEELDDDTYETEAAFPYKALVMLGAPSAEGGREVMASRGERSGRVGSNSVGADLSLSPSAAGAGDLLRLSPAKTISVVKAAIRLQLDLEVLYPVASEEEFGGLSRVTPSSVTEAGGSSSFKGYDHRLKKEMDYRISRINGIRLAQ